MTSNELTKLEARFDSLEQKLEQKLESVIRLEEGLKHVVDALKGCPMCQQSTATHEVEIKSLKESVDELKNWQTWAVRLVLGAVGLAVVYQVIIH
jgi:chromosome segregation ATPase